MKKMLFSMFVAILTMTSCNNETVGNFSMLPVQAQTMITSCLDKDNISFVLIEKGLFKKEYEVSFNDATKVEFDKNGMLTKADFEHSPVPECLIPEAVLTYVHANFPNASITEWTKDDGRWKAELNNGLELKFKSNYQFLSVDD